MIRAILISACAGVVLSACTESMTPEERLVSYQQSCLAYGFEVGTDKFAECIQSLDAQYVETRRQDAMLAAAYIGQMNRNRVSCTTNASVYGSYGTSTTNCY